MLTEMSLLLRYWEKLRTLSRYVHRILSLKNIIVIAITLIAIQEHEIKYIAKTDFILNSMVTVETFQENFEIRKLVDLMKILFSISHFYAEYGLSGSQIKTYIVFRWWWK